ncbi:MAG TPA: hypothetical protein VEL76_32545 [Gemmataceae bacterium]|nr:hypothetical protein [Gemmataceae bacterium]
MSPTATPAAEPQPFDSLADLQDDHARLVKEIGAALLATGNPERVAAFIDRAVATGALLDGEDDRAAAQGLLNFWVARLAAAAQTAERKGGKEAATPSVPLRLSNTLLRDFDSATFEQAAAAADNWWQQLPPLDQLLARRLLLRLLRLRDDHTTWEVRPNTLEGVSERLDPREADESALQQKAKQFLLELGKLGIVRAIPNPSGFTDYALRSPELLDRWERLRGWMDERRNFRQMAVEWAKRREEKEKAEQGSKPLLHRIWERACVWTEKFGAFLLSVGKAVRTRIRGARPAGDGLSRQEYDEAETYRDRNKDELRLIFEKQALDRQRTERAKIRAALAFFVVLLLLVFALCGWSRALSYQHAEEVRKLTVQTRLLTSHARTALATDRQRSVLLTLEALKINPPDPGAGTPDDREQFSTERNKATEILGEALRSMDGTGYYANLGTVTALAAHETPAGDLRWLAAAGSNGSIALWDFANPRRPKQEILPFGYAPPLQHLWITGEGTLLAALNYRNNLTVWDLNDPDRHGGCRVFEFGLSPFPVMNVDISDDGGMARDGRRAYGRLVHSPGRCWQPIATIPL